YCNAGHNPPALLRADGTTEWLKGGGLILGVMARARYEEFRVTMNRGDTLVLFSDGVTEAVPPGSDEEFGEDRLAALLHQNHALGAQELIDAVNADVNAWSAGAPPADDVTLVVAKRT
ncbi:MAG TPA: protein serine phosphatase, partial [Solibacterales bacterium]|nr:protein serine phosphatase [Bryobacterales bacterium]